MPRAFRFGAGRDWTSWPVLLLLITVLVPSAGVVWMMRAAMDNERLAVRQRLADAYQVQLESARRGVSEHWREKLERLDVLASGRTAGEAFARCALSREADSVVVLDEAGVVLYPNSINGEVGGGADDDPVWQRAQRLEFAAADPVGAAKAYEAIAASTGDPLRKARARQAQARCLLRAGHREAALGVLRELRADGLAVDERGRWVAAEAELRLLELLDAGSAEREDIAASLAARLNRYEPPLPPAAQRRFLMHRLAELVPEQAALKLETMAAEELAAEFVASPSGLPSGTRFQPTAVSEVWSIRSPGGRVAALYRTTTLESQLHGVLADQLLPEGVTLEARRPGESGDVDSELLAVSLGPALPGWRLAMGFTGGAHLDQAANVRMASFAWTAAILVAITLLLAGLVASGLRRQMRVARLKNDLVATVSHELKTPLASIRLLVDTLLDGDRDLGAAPGINGKSREYLEMIAHENARLTRLIDNFLTFSRMDRGKHRFACEPVDAREVVAQAAAAVGDRFDGIRAKLEVEAEGPLGIRGDLDALVTAVVNLLDNAWKYTGPRKRVRLTARRAGNGVEIAVEDNGVGLAPRAARRVFDRFFQVDQRLSRPHDGCGLGLSIVRYIVEAHGGTAAVESRVGEGSRFTLTLPVDASGVSTINAANDWSLKRPVRKGDAV